MKIYAINLPSALTLGGTYDGGGASLLPRSRDSMQWAVGLQQQQRRARQRSQRQCRA